MHQMQFLRSQAIGIGRVDGGQHSVTHLIDGPVDSHRALLAVDAVEQTPMVHVPLRVAFYKRALEFELYD